MRSGCQTALLVPLFLAFQLPITHGSRAAPLTFDWANWGDQGVSDEAQFDFTHIHETKAHPHNTSLLHEGTGGDCKWTKVTYVVPEYAQWPVDGWKDRYEPWDIDIEDGELVYNVFKLGTYGEEVLLNCKDKVQVSAEELQGLNAEGNCRFVCTGGKWTMDVKDCICAVPKLRGTGDDQFSDEAFKSNGQQKYQKKKTNWDLKAENDREGKAYNMNGQKIVDDAQSEDHFATYSGSSLLSSVDKESQSLGDRDGDGDAVTGENLSESEQDSSYQAADHDPVKEKSAAAKSAVEGKMQRRKTTVEVDADAESLAETEKEKKAKEKELEREKERSRKAAKRRAQKAKEEREKQEAALEKARKEEARLDAELEMKEEEEAKQKAQEEQAALEKVKEEEKEEEMRMRRHRQRAKEELKKAKEERERAEQLKKAKEERERAEQDAFNKALNKAKEEEKEEEKRMQRHRQRAKEEKERQRKAQEERAKHEALKKAKKDSAPEALVEEELIYDEEVERDPLP